MGGGHTRRAVLGAVVGAVAGTVATGRGRAGEPEPCEELELARMGLAGERELHALVTAELEAAEQRIASLRAEITTLRDAARPPHPYDEAQREEARRVGLEARSGVALLDYDQPGAREGLATAWFVDEHHLLTNAHNADPIEAETVLRGWTLEGASFGVEFVEVVEDKQPDVALLRADRAAPRVLTTAEPESVEPGDRLVQVGHPAIAGNWLISLGELIERDSKDLVTTVPAAGGASGSPLLDLDGRVAGMLYSGRDADGEDWTVPPAPISTDVIQYPMVEPTHALHVPIEDAMALYEGWT